MLCFVASSSHDVHERLSSWCIRAHAHAIYHMHSCCAACAQSFYYRISQWHIPLVLYCTCAGHVEMHIWLCTHTRTHASLATMLMLIIKSTTRRPKYIPIRAAGRSGCQRAVLVNSVEKPRRCNSASGRSMAHADVDAVDMSILV